MDLIARGARWLDQVQTDKVSQSVEYVRRGETTGIICRATIGRSQAQQVQGDGLEIVQNLNDFIINANELVFDGEDYEPVPGDYILWNGARFRVGFINDEPAWRWASPPLRDRRRIHAHEQAGPVIEDEDEDDDE